MSRGFVVDASVALTWCFQADATPASLRLLDRLVDERITVPAWWMLELANSMRAGERRGLVSAVELERFVRMIEGMDIEFDSEAHQRAFADYVPLARAHRVTVYSAMYLELALRRRLALATLDEELRRAAAEAGVDLLGV